MYRWMIVLVTVLLATPAWATTRYVDSTLGVDCAGGAGTSYSVALRNCSASDGTRAWNTIAEGLTPTVAGDTLYIRGGIYNQVLHNLTGKSGSAIAGYTTIAGYSTETVTLRAPLGSSVATVIPYIYMRFENLIFDGVNSGDAPTGDTTGRGFFITYQSHHVIVRNVEIKNQYGHGILIGSGVANTPYVTEVLIQNSRFHDARSDCALGRRWYGIYYSQGSNVTSEGSEFYGEAGAGIQIYPGPLTGTNIFRNNLVHDNPTCGIGNQNGGVIVGTDGVGPVTNVQIYNNSIYHNGYVSGAQRGHGINVFGNSNAQGTKIWNNVIYDNTGALLTYGIRVSISPQNAVIQNNIIFGNKTSALGNQDGPIAAGTYSFNACATADATCGATGKVPLSALTQCTVSLTDFAQI